MTPSEMLAKIATFAALEKNWDGYGADPINAPTRTLAMEMVHRLPLGEWVVAPTCDGEILFEEPGLEGRVIIVWAPRPGD